MPTFVLAVPQLEQVAHRLLLQKRTDDIHPSNQEAATHRLLTSSFRLLYRPCRICPYPALGGRFRPTCQNSSGVWCVTYGSWSIELAGWVMTRDPRIV